MLRIEADALPEVDRQTIISAYRIAAGNPERLPEFGLHGDGPWRIVLAGYVLHALSRATDQIRREPYQAGRGDEFF